MVCLIYFLIETTVQHSTVQYSTVQYSTAQYSTVQDHGPSHQNVTSSFLCPASAATTACSAQAAVGWLMGWLLELSTNIRFTVLWC